VTASTGHVAFVLPRFSVAGVISSGATRGPRAPPLNSCVKPVRPNEPSSREGTTAAPFSTVQGSPTPSSLPPGYTPADAGHNTAIRACATRGGKPLAQAETVLQALLPRQASLDELLVLTWRSSLRPFS
jgi:hypothetical protein